MNTNSDRYAVQLYVEAAIGCPSSAELPAFVERFEKFTIGHQAYVDVRAALTQDARSLLRKGIKTIFQALHGLDNGHESWALIKLYYSTFFLLRETLAADNLAIIRCKNIYSLEINIAEKPTKHVGKNYRGDHQATIRLQADRMVGRDILLSQHIASDLPYDWLRDKREWINYRRRDFIDSGGELGFSDLEMNYPDQVKLFCNDAIPVYCFQADTAALALPLKRAQASINERSYGMEILAECIADARAGGPLGPSCEAFVKTFN